MSQEEQTRSKQARGELFERFETCRYWVVGLLVALSYLVAWYFSPYSLSVAQDLLVLAVTVFSITLVAYVFLHNLLASHVELINTRIRGLQRQWSDKEYEFASDAIPRFRRRYDTVFLFMKCAEGLLFFSFIPTMYTVFVSNFRAVEALGLGFVISAIVLLFGILLLHLSHYSPASQFKRLQLDLDAVREQHENEKTQDKKDKPENIQNGYTSSDGKEQGESL